LIKAIGPAALVLLVGAPPDIEEPVRRLCGHIRVTVIREAPAAPGGSVTLVGGGPGPTALLTGAGYAALADADVVFYDRLAPSEDLVRLSPGAELVDVGKRPYHHPVSQHRIERRMIKRARQGLDVVRLKGGDPYVFGRGREEVLACSAAGIPVRVVPGVSSAISVPGAAGIPLTHRGISHCFSVVSGHAPLGSDELEALVRLGGTIVILMGIGNLAQISAGLLRAGLDGRTSAAVVERGFSTTQRATFTVLGRLADDVRRLEVSSPAVIVIGDVVGLAQGGESVAAEFAARTAGTGAA
jgi:uroporphyrin-III C-methyltransferase